MHTPHNHVSSVGGKKIALPACVWCGKGVQKLLACCMTTSWNLWSLSNWLTAECLVHTRRDVVGVDCSWHVPDGLKCDL